MLLLIFYCNHSTMQWTGRNHRDTRGNGKKDPPNEEKPGNNDQEGNEPGDNEPKENTSVDKTGEQFTRMGSH